MLARASRIEQAHWWWTKPKLRTEARGDWPWQCTGLAVENVAGQRDELQGCTKPPRADACEAQPKRQRAACSSKARTKALTFAFSRARRPQAGVRRLERWVGRGARVSCRTSEPKERVCTALSDGQRWCRAARCIGGLQTVQSGGGKATGRGYCCSWRRDELTKATSERRAWRRGAMLPRSAARRAATGGGGGGQQTVRWPPADGQPTRTLVCAGRRGAEQLAQRARVRVPRVCEARWRKL